MISHLPLRIAVLLAGTLATAAASAQEAQENGWYGGLLLGLGYGHSSNSEVSLPNVPSVVSSTISSPSNYPAPAASFVLGKQWPANGRIAFGLEFEPSVQGSAASANAANRSGEYIVGFNHTISLNNGDLVASIPFQAVLRLRASFALTPTISAYASVGPALGAAHVRASNLNESYGATEFLFRPPFPPDIIPFDTFSTTSSATWKAVAALDVGAGLEADVGAHVALRAEYSLTQFQTIKQATGNASFAVAPLFQRAEIGLVRRF